MNRRKGMLITLFFVSCCLYSSGQDCWKEFSDSLNAKVAPLRNGKYHAIFNFSDNLLPNTIFYEGTCYFSKDSVPFGSLADFIFFEHDTIPSFAYVGNRFYEFDETKKQYTSKFLFRSNFYSKSTNNFKHYLSISYLLNNLQSPFDDDLNNKGDSMFCDCKYAGFMKLDSLKSAQYGVQPIKRYHYIKRNDNTETIEISNTTVFPDRRRSMLWLVDNMQPINSGYAFLQKELTKITTKYTLVPSADFDDPNRVLPPPQLPGEKLLLDSVPITTLTTFDGAPYSLDKVRGKMILLDFWFINCQACAKTMPEIQKVYEKYNSNGLAVVGINPFDFDLDSVKSTMKKYGIEYPVYMDYTSELVTKLGILSYPTLILFDPGTKKISAFHVGSTDLSDFLKIVDDNFRKQ